MEDRDDFMAEFANDFMAFSIALNDILEENNIALIKF